jgi:hypothetical protein
MGMVTLQFIRATVIGFWSIYPVERTARHQE